MRMEDVCFHEKYYPKTVDEIKNDVDAIKERVSDAADRGVTVVQLHFSDEFLYVDWIDDDGFSQNRATLEAVAEFAHELDLHVLVYMNGLEVLTPGANPLGERQGFSDDVPSMRSSGWLQQTPEGTDIWFTGIEQKGDFAVDYIQSPTWETAWMCPLTDYRALFLGRVQSVMEAGADGVFVDVAFLPGLPELVPEFLDLPEERGHVAACYNAACQQAFSKDTGFEPQGPKDHLDWNTDGWRQWIRWRYELIRDYYADIAATVRSVRGEDGLMLVETSANDVPEAAVAFGNDNTQAPVGVTPELPSPTGEGDDCQESVGNYLDFFTMAKFARAENRKHGRAFVPLGSVRAVADGRMQFGILAATAGSYFTFVSGDFSSDKELELFLGESYRFLENHSELFTEPEPAAHVALLYSPHTRDFVDRLAGKEFEADEDATPHFGTYRAVARALAEAHVPYEIVFPEETTSEELAGYDVVVAPNVQCLSTEAAAKLEEYAKTHRLLAIGDFATLDLLGWPEPKEVVGTEFVELDAKFVDQIDNVRNFVTLTGTTPVLLDVTRSRDALVVHLVNLGAADDGDCASQAAPTKDLEISVVVENEPEQVTLLSPEWPNEAKKLEFMWKKAQLTVELPEIHTYTAVVIE